MPTRSELLYFAAGLAIGGAAGANWPKIRAMLEPFLATAAEGVGAAHTDVARKFSEYFEAAQDTAAQRRHETNGSAKEKRKRKPAKPSANGSRATVQI